MSKVEHKGGLFSGHFLNDEKGICDLTEWGKITADEVKRFRADALAQLVLLNGGTGLAVPQRNESDTIGDFIAPILDLLGWRNLRHREPNIGSGSRPDMLLFADQAGKQAGLKESAAGRYDEACKHAAAVLEAKKWNLALDRREAGSGKAPRSAPSSQMLRYLRDIEKGAEWGILTNGVLWRLYFRRANSKSEHFLELDLENLLRDESQENGVRVFMLMFGRDSFANGFHEKALAKSRNWEATITGDLSQDIFGRVFPELARALAKGERSPDTARLRRIAEDTMTLLFRLLFVLYAEDRGLLPVGNKRLRRYSLAEIRRLLDEDDIDDIPSNVYLMFAKFRNLCAAINKGNKQMLIPPYNGGLFSPRHAPLLESKDISDYDFAKAVKTLAYRDDKRINYRDLSVQHLGAMYERFLELELAISGGGKGQIIAKPNRYARKSGGSYYTPEELVHLVIDGAVGVLLREYRAEFNSAVKQNAPMAKLKKLDPAMRGLRLKVCDPAMGSGHFLVSLVDYLADWALAEIAAAEGAVDGYHSPLSAEIESVRERIKKEAKEGGWHIDEHHLDDRQIIRRLVLKRAVYGADKNPMAVELAKLSLWLHTFTVGAPLTFLDHHLRHGDSLFGEFAADAMSDLGKLGKPLMAKPLLQMAQSAAEEMQQIESVTDSSIAEVQSSIAAFDKMQGKSAPFNHALTLLHCRHWFAAEDGKMQHLNPLAAVEAALQGKELSAGGAEYAKRAEALCARENFIHWETAFPGIWSNWANGKKRIGGFDAVIGNPPWAKMRVSETGWFDVHDPTINEVMTQAERDRKIEERRKKGDPIIGEYDDAVRRANAAIDVARQCGVYPQMSRGDINLYALFVERASALIAPEGTVGLLVPSDIFSGLNTSAFFGNIVSGGRMSAILDFVNSPYNYFADVHKSFKFCVFAFGGSARQFAKTECAFFINKKKNNENHRVVFAPGDFDAINPNTGSAPVCKTQRDADIIIDIHRRLPILQKEGEAPLYKVKYTGMLHVAGDSDKFITAATLEKRGYYPVAPNLYKKGDDICPPLYTGRMIDLYNHRAASVTYNAANVHRHFNTEQSTVEQLRSPSFCPTPPFWVKSEYLKAHKDLTWFMGYRDVTAATNRRTVIAALVPRAAYANTVLLLMPTLPPEPKKPTKAELKKWQGQCSRIIAEYKSTAPLLTANLSSFALDFIARQKNAGLHIQWHLLRQLPIIAPEVYQQKAGGETIGDFVRGRVLRLAYTADDMTPFARDMGHKGKPFIWDEQERLHLRAQLDALYFLLYGINNDDAAYMMDSFPIVKKHDEKTTGGYQTRDLILRYLNAYRAKDWQAKPVTPAY